MYITMGHNMLGWPVPAFFDHNHLGLALTEMLLALIVMYVNKDFFLSGGKSLVYAIGYLGSGKAEQLTAELQALLKGGTPVETHDDAEMGTT